MKIGVQLARIIVGILFIFSGLIKANDPQGLSYKMQEFFEVWGLHALNDFSLMLSIIMIAFEIVAGVAVLVGWQMRLFTWLLLILIVFFTFLTGYALFSGKIKTCGCFGDCIPLTAQQSFIKDIILLLLILFIYKFQHLIKPLFSTRVSIVLLIIATVLSLDSQWYVLKHLPIIDCLPYKKGKSIAAQMKAPPGSIPDSTVINFVYQKNGKNIEFTADAFPDDFDDSIYQFVKRYDKIVRKGNAEPPIKDFALFTKEGSDTTTAILQQPGLKLMVFTKGLTELKPAWVNQLKSVYQIAATKNIPVYMVTNDETVCAQWLQKTGLASSTILLKCDYVAVKTAARTNPTLYVLNGDVIINKWGYADFNFAVPMVTKLPLQ